MKDQEKNKPTKKRIITYYLILAASILVVAAIAVGVVFAVRNRSNLSNPGGVIENPGDDANKPDDKNPDDTNKPDDKEPEKPTTGNEYKFVMPVETPTVSQAQVFFHNKTLNRYQLHKGMDFSAAAGTKVLAAQDGTITNIALKDKLYGAYIEIEHADGVKTVYKYIDPVESLKIGDKVTRGQQIATIATATGAENADGDHLHFEMYKDNKLANPDDYFESSSK